MKAVSFRFHELGRYSAFVRKLSEAPESLVALGYVRPEKAAFEKRIRFLEENFNPKRLFTKIKKPPFHFEKEAILLR
jgi:hypothetical protein